MTIKLDNETALRLAKEAGFYSVKSKGEIYADIAATIHSLEVGEEVTKLIELSAEWGAQQELKKFDEFREFVFDTLVELNTDNYTHDDICKEQSAVIEIIMDIQNNRNKS